MLSEIASVGLGVYYQLFITSLLTRTTQQATFLLSFFKDSMDLLEELDKVVGRHLRIESNQSEHNETEASRRL
jgi:hypothetical protein